MKIQKGLNTRCLRMMMKTIDRRWKCIFINYGSSGKSVGDFFIFISPATYKSVFLTSDIPHPLTHKPFSV
jgi:hypothetical protein